MKQLTLILALSICLASCKKQNNTPSQQATQNSTTTPTTIPTSTTTANDTVGKVKIYYKINFSYVVTTSTATPVVPDFKQDTSGVRIFLNGTRLTDHNVYIPSTVPTTGLNQISTIYNADGSPDKAIWVKQSNVANGIVGDTLIIECDHLELRYGNSGNNSIVPIRLEVYNASKQSISYEGVNPYINITNNSLTYGNPTAIAYYGANGYATLIGFDSTPLNIKWYLGGKFRYKFIF